MKIKVAIVTAATLVIALVLYLVMQPVERVYIQPKGAVPSTTASDYVRHGLCLCTFRTGHGRGRSSTFGFWETVFRSLNKSIEGAIR